MRKTSDELRRTFIEFFKERGHPHLPQAPLVPLDDPTLLFTSAGMVQFKPYFSSPLPPPHRRAVTVQRCLRLTDVENVGLTVRHATFFEMLGNFSFGDYFKKEAIEWAWEFTTRVLGMTPERLFPSVYKEDQEAFDLWANHIGLGAKRVTRLGEKDNFWGPAGGSGACGPCSEIYWDQGQGVGCGRAECAPGCDCERYLEFWNLVFPQFDQLPTGERRPLANRGIDTGMGLERLAMILQGSPSVFETDLLLPIGDAARRLGSPKAAGILEEETRFEQTLERGLSRFEETVAGLEKGKIREFPGAIAFQLYDTYGFPIDLTVEMAGERGLAVDMPGYESAMKEQRERA